MSELIAIFLLGFVGGTLFGLSIVFAVWVYKAQSESKYKEKLSWLGKNCKDCGNEKCKKLGTLPKEYDCALWQPESEE